MVTTLRKPTVIAAQRESSQKCTFQTKTATSEASSADEYKHGFQTPTFNPAQTSFSARIFIPFYCIARMRMRATLVGLKKDKSSPGNARMF